MKTNRRFLLPSRLPTKTAKPLPALPAPFGWRRGLQSVLLASFLSVPLFGIAASYGRDDMPPPSRAPRTPVTSERLAIPEIPTEIAGGATAVDGQTIRLREASRDLVLRLAGVVAPPVTSNEGLVARAALDAIVKDQTVNCSRRDRDNDGRAIMNCTYNGGQDVAEALLFTGTVLYSRAGTLPQELAVRYKAAEETAQARRVGLWKQVASVNVGAAATTASANTASSVRPAAAAPAPVAAKPVATLVPVEEAPVAQTSDSGFGRWLQAMGLLGALFGMLAWLDTRHTRRERLRHDLEIRSERQVLAAALSGELAAARDICEARAAQIVSARGKSPSWPRLRTYIYQAHVEHIGLLGPILARQIASIYGQMADYAASPRDEADNTTAAAMARTLARLCGYIEIALEGLTDVEQTGETYYPADGMIGSMAASEQHAAQVVRKVTQKLPAATAPATTTPPTPPKKIAAPVATQPVTQATAEPTADADMLEDFAAPKEARTETAARATAAPVAESPADKGEEMATADEVPVAEDKSVARTAVPLPIKSPASKTTAAPAATAATAPSGQIPWWKQRQLQKAAEAKTAPTKAKAETRTPLASRMAERQKAVEALKAETAKLEALDTGIVAPDVPMGATA